MSDKQRVAFVTGGAGGIGLGVGQKLAQDGCAVALVDLNEEGAKKAAAETDAGPGKLIGVGCDVADTQSVNDAVAKVAEELGPIDISVSNAGVTRDNLLFKMSDDDWDTVMKVHLRGAFLIARAVQGHMVEQGWGRIINMSSVNAYGAKGQANYSTAKMGLQAFTRTLAMELGGKGVTVNAVAPGFIKTPMTIATAERLKLEPEAFFESIAKVTPVRRVGEPADIAAIVGFLASDAASFITGQTINVDGGLRLNS